MNELSPRSNEATDRGHSIKIVSQRTGLSSHVIRVWERRYGAVIPRRSETNRRLYSDDDIHRLRLLGEATENGHTIGNIAGLTGDELRDLLKDDQNTPHRYEPSEGGDPEPHLEQSLKAVRELDAEGLQSVLERASVDLSQLVVLEDVIVPLMHKIGDLWHEGELRVVHEHAANAVVCAFVSTLKTAYVASVTAPTAVVATPSGQLHELGALIVAATAAAEGWRTAYLGASLPVEEIAKAAEIQQARVVALSIIYPPHDVTLQAELARLRRLLPSNVAILVGGRSSQAYEQILQKLDIEIIPNLRSLRERLQKHHP